jgi:hypothetical protein
VRQRQEEVAVAVDAHNAISVERVVSREPHSRSGSCLAQNSGESAGSSRGRRRLTGDAVALICAECGALSASAADGWRAYLTDDGEAVMFCPACAEREFGEA